MPAARHRPDASPQEEAAHVRELHDRIVSPARGGRPMMRYQWNTLRVGDAVLVHTDRGELLGGTVVTVTEQDAGGDREIGVRVHDDERVRSPTPAEVHTDPLDVNESCVHCDLLRTFEQRPSEEEPTDADAGRRLIALRRSGMTYAAMATTMNLAGASAATTRFIEAVRDAPAAERVALCDEERTRLTALEGRINRSRKLESAARDRQLQLIARIRRRLPSD